MDEKNRQPQEPHKQRQHLDSFSLCLHAAQKLQPGKRSRYKRDVEQIKKGVERIKMDNKHGQTPPLSEKSSPLVARVRSCVNLCPAMGTRGAGKT